MIIDGLPILPCCDPAVSSIVTIDKNLSLTLFDMFLIVWQLTILTPHFQSNRGWRLNHNEFLASHVEYYIKIV